MAEAVDGLWRIVLEDVESILVQGLHAAAGTIQRCNVQANLVGILA